MRHGRAPAAAVGLAVLAGLAGCRRQTAAPPDVVAVVAGDEVRYAAFEQHLVRQLGDAGASLASDVLSELFDQFVDEILLSRLAVDEGLAPAAVAGPDARPGARRRAVDRLLAAAGSQPEPGEAEVAAWYEAHRDELVRPERVRLRQLLVADRASAIRALAELRAGADLAAVARRHAADPTAAALAGHEEELSRDELPPAFADTIFALAPGEISEPVEAEYGFHLFWVKARLPAQVVPLDEARAEIERTLAQQAADRRLATLVERARRRYDVAIFERNLPFNYQGFYFAGS